MAPSRYPNQCWLAIKGVLWHIPEINFTRSTVHELINPYHVFRDYHFKIITTSPRGQWVNSFSQHTRAAQFSFRPGDYLPQHFGLNFRNPSYIYIRACCIIYSCGLYHSVHKFAINNPNLCIISLEIFNWKYWFDNLSGHLLWPSED